jgi:hypothetical protein
MVRDLKGTMEREKAALGLFLTLNEPRNGTGSSFDDALYECAG